MGTTGTASIARWKNADRMWWLVIVAFAIRTHTSSSVLQKAGVQRNAAFAISNGATDHVVMAALAQSRHSLVHRTCLLLGVKQTSPFAGVRFRGRYWG